MHIILTKQNIHWHLKDIKQKIKYLSISSLLIALERGLGEANDCSSLRSFCCKL